MRNTRLKSESSARKTRNTSNLQNKRILQYNLVYVIGLSEEIAKEKVLARKEYIGQYGSIKKVTINNNRILTGNEGYSYSAYINFEKKQDAALAVLALECAKIGNNTVKASFGTTKYCNNFISSIPCRNKECLYLHKMGDEQLTVDKDDMAIDKKLFSDQIEKAVKIADLSNPNTRTALKTRNCSKAVFPNIETILNKESVQVHFTQETSKDYSNLKEIIHTDKKPSSDRDFILESNSIYDLHYSSPYAPKSASRFSFEKESEVQSPGSSGAVSSLLSNYFKKYAYFIKTREIFQREEIQGSISRYKTDDWLQDVDKIFNRILS